MSGGWNGTSSGTGLARVDHLVLPPYAPRTMIATRDSTAETMLRALSHSLGALDAAIESDVDRTADDRTFFSIEKAALQPLFDDVSKADQALTQHLLLKRATLQARIELGDVV